jgi:hypothetical protein
MFILVVDQFVFLKKQAGDLKTSILQLVRSSTAHSLNLQMIQIKLV